MFTLFGCHQLHAEPVDLNLEKKFGESSVWQKIRRRKFRSVKIPLRKNLIRRKIRKAKIAIGKFPLDGNSFSGKS